MLPYRGSNQDVCKVKDDVDAAATKMKIYTMNRFLRRERKPHHSRTDIMCSQFSISMTRDLIDDAKAMSWQIFGDL